MTYRYNNGGDDNNKIMMHSIQLLIFILIPHPLQSVSRL